METRRGEAARANGVWLDRTTPPHIVTLVLLTGISAINMNMVLPSLPRIAAHFGADYGVVALTLSGYLALTALLQLVFGPLSDRFGRRPVILASFLIFLAATLGCVFAPDIHSFLVFRMVQASIASGIALTRAIVRDMVQPDQAASMLGYVTMGMSVMPMVGPMIGGFLDEAFGWQAIFVFTFVTGAAIFALVWADLGETNTAPSASFAAQFHAYPELLGSRRFWGYALTVTFASGAYFAFLGGSPWVASELLGLSPSALGFYFGFIALGYMGGNFLSGRYTGRVGLNGMMLIGGVVAMCGILLAMTLFLLGLVNAPSFFGSVLLVGAGNGLLLPSGNAGLVSVRPHLAGSASGLGGAMMVGGGAALAVLAGALLGPGTGAWPLLWIMLACCLASLGAALFVIREAKTHGP